MRSLRVGLLLGLAAATGGTAPLPGQRDRLDAIVRGEAFSELGDHGQAVALYLAATRAATWTEAEGLLERIWREYPGSAAVDVAHAFAGRHYRDAGDAARAADHFSLALTAARARNRGWAHVLKEELDALPGRVSQLPGRTPAPTALSGDMVRVDSSLGEWTAEAPARVAVRPDDAAVIDVTLDRALFSEAVRFTVRADLVAVGAQFRARCGEGVYTELAFTDADDTRVAAINLTGDRDADGSWLVSLDFSQLPNAGRGNYVMERLETITVRIVRPSPAAAEAHVELSDLALRVGDPVRTSDAPEGDVALQPAAVFTDGYGIEWRARMHARVAPEADAAKDGRPGYRLTARVDDRGGGFAVVTPPKGVAWQGSKLVFWCRPHDTPFLPVLVHEPDGTQLVKQLTEAELAVGEWRRIEVDFATSAVGARVDDTFDAVRAINLVVSPTWDRTKRYLAASGDYTFDIADLHLEGEGSVTLAAAPPETAPPATPRRSGLYDENGTHWGPTPPLTVAVDRNTVREGAGAMRVAVPINPEAPKGSGGHVLVTLPEDREWFGDRLVFWCYPQDVPFLPILVNDRAYNQIAAQVGPDQLRVGQWNRVEVDLRAEAPLTVRGDSFGPVATVWIVPHTSWDRKREYLREPREYVWYIEDLHVEGEGPIQLVRDEGSCPDVGLDMSWGTTGDCTVAPETREVASGEGAARMAVQLRPDSESGGRARIKPPGGAAWPGSAIRFACRAETVAYLDVMAADTDGTTVVWYLRKDDLAVGEWRDIELDAENMVSAGAGDGQFSDFAWISFQCEGASDPRRMTLPREGEVVWFLDDFAITRDQPAPVRRVYGAAPARDDDKTWEWKPFGRAMVDEELAIVKEGARSLRLALLPERPGARAPGWLIGTPSEPQTCSAVYFQLRPTDLGGMRVMAYDGQGRSAAWTLTLDQLGPDQWNEFLLFMAEAARWDRQGRAIAPEEFGPLTELRFELSPGDDPTQARTWYLDDVQLLTEAVEP